jgi:ABC-type multidrug transport system permease subunit
MQVCAINTAMSSIVKTLRIFPKERVIVSRERAKGSYSVAPYLTAKLLAELPIGAIFPVLFGIITYPLCGLNPHPTRFLKFLSILTLESFTSSALGLAVGAFAPSAEAARAIGPAVMVVWIVFGGYYVNQDNVPRMLRWLPSASLIKQGFQALCLNEFPGLAFEPDTSGRGMLDGDQVRE